MSQGQEGIVQKKIKWNRMDQLTRPEKDVPVVQLFTKVPFPGKVKTRLIPEMGIAGATEAYWELLNWVVPRIHHASLWQTQVWLANIDYFKVGPFGKDIEQRFLNLFEPYDMRYCNQSEGNLGHRLNDALRKSALQANKTIIVGGDGVSINQETIKDAMNLLEKADVVVSPSEDGGFLLLGANSPIPGLESDVEWGEDSALQGLLQVCERESLKVTQLTPGFDVDTYVDWVRFQAMKKNASRSTAYQPMENFIA